MSFALEDFLQIFEAIDNCFFFQSENQEDCFNKLQAMLLECKKELLDNRLPTDQDKAILNNRYAAKLESKII